MNAIARLGEDIAAGQRRDSFRLRGSRAATWLITGLSWAVGLVVVWVIGSIFLRGLPALSWEFIATKPLENMSAGGIRPMIRGTLLLMVGTFALVLPIGVLAGIYLAEYAGGKWVGYVRALITSLAGTPSIIYGLFGLAVFVLLLTKKFSLIAGWMTLATMALPLIVLSTEQAVRSVPHAQIDGAIALGLTKWQAIWRVVLPQALPGILTGILLATGRAAGEAPPILLTAGVFYQTVEPQGLEAVTEPVMNLAYYITEGYRQPGAIPDKFVWGACLALMALILAINFVGIVIRSRLRRKLTS